MPHTITVRKASRGLVAAAVVSLAVTGCGGSSDTASGDGEGSDLTIGFSGFDQNTAFLSTLSDQVEQAATGAGAQVNVASADSDTAQQANDINTLVAGGATGILVDPVNADAVVPAIERAASGGAAVVTIDGTAAPSDGIAMQVATDNYGAGQEACQLIGDLVGGQGTVLNLQGGLDNQAAQGRSNGFTECMAESYPDITVVSRSYNWDAAQCLQLARTQLSSQEIAGVFAASAQCLGPVTSTLDGQGRLNPVGTPGHVPFVVVDGTPEELAAVRDGTLTASIEQPLADMAEAGVYWLERAVAGEAIEAGPTDHGTEVREIDGTLRDLLAPVVVTAENVDDPERWANDAG